MKEPQNKIDKVFTDKLQDLEREPSEKIWAAIQTELGDSNIRHTSRNNFLNFYSILALSLAGITLSAWLISSDYGQETAEMLPASVPALVSEEMPGQPVQDQSTATAISIPEKQQAPNHRSAATTTNKEEQIIPPSSTFTIQSGADYTDLNMRDEVIRIEHTGDQYLISGLSDSSILKVIRSPKNGQVVIDKAGKFNYKPNKGFSGVDSFTYIIQYSDGTRSSEGLIKINVEPETSSCLPDFQFEMMEGNVVRFTNLSPALRQKNGRWNFGDGESSSEPNPVHTYRKEGTYTVCLKLESPDCNRQSCKTLSVYNNKDSLDRTLKKPEQIAKNYEIMGLQDKPISINIGRSGKAQSLRRALKKDGVENVLLSDSAGKKERQFGRSGRDFGQEEEVEPNDRPQSDFSLAIFGMPEHTYRTVSSKTDDGYRKARNDAEKPLTGYTIGAEINYALNDHLFIATGFAYSKKSENVDYTVVREDNNDTTFIITSQSTNQYTYFRIPLRLGYLFEWGSFRFGPASGLALNLLKSGKAVILNTERNNLLLLSQDDFSPLCFSYTGGLHLAFMINNSIAVFAEPGVQYFLTTQLKNSFPEQFPYAYGIGAGLSCKF